MANDVLDIEWNPDKMIDTGIRSTDTAKPAMVLAQILDKLIPENKFNWNVSWVQGIFSLNGVLQFKIDFRIDLSERIRASKWTPEYCAAHRYDFDTRIHVRMDVYTCPTYIIMIVEHLRDSSEADKIYFNPDSSNKSRKIYRQLFGVEERDPILNELIKATRAEKHRVKEEWRTRIRQATEHFLIDNPRGYYPWYAPEGERRKWLERDMLLSQGLENILAPINSEYQAKIDELNGRAKARLE